MPADPDELLTPGSEEEVPGFYPIRTVSTLTGVNAITLRAWERRYGLIKPHRTASGHRLYTQQDIDLINRVVELLNKGISISQVRKRLAAESAGHGAEPHAPSPATLDTWGIYAQRMINAIVRFDQDALENTYNEALSLYPIDTVTTRLVVPLLRTLGQRWASAEGSVAEEHFFSAYLRNKLGARFHHQAQRRSGHLLVMACLPGEYHEIGLLLFGLSAAARDYRMILLGANTPLAELPLVVTRSRADAIVLSGSSSLNARALETELATLTRRLAAPVFIGGAASVACRDEIVRAGAIPIGEDIGSALRRLDERLGAAQQAESTPEPSTR